MKKITLLFLMIVCSIATYSQTLEVYSHGIKLEAGQEYVINTTDVNVIELIFEANVKNTATVDQSVGLAIAVLDHTEGIDVAGCWVDCLEPWNFEFDALEIPAGEQTGDGNFSIHYYPNGKVGDARVSFRLFSVANPNDFFEATLVFTSGYTESLQVISGSPWLYNSSLTEPIVFNANIRNATLQGKYVAFTGVDLTHDSDVDVIATWGEEGVEGNLTSFDPIEINGGATTANGVFSLKYVPNGKETTIKIYCEFTVIDELNPETSVDTVSFTVTFQSGGVSISEKVRTNTKAYPNPASDKISVKYEFNQPVLNAEITLFNVLGVPVASQQLNGNKGNSEINVSDFSSGIYFYIIKADGKVIETKKIIISR